MDKISYALMLVPIPCVQVSAIGFKALRLAGNFFSKMASRGSREAIALFAFGIFELFRFSEVVKQEYDLPQITLAEKLQGQVLYRPTEELFSEKSLSKRVQFRYRFERVYSDKVQQSCIEGKLDTG